MPEGRGPTNVGSLQPITVAQGARGGGWLAYATKVGKALEEGDKKQNTKERLATVRIASQRRIKKGDMV